MIKILSGVFLIVLASFPSYSRSPKPTWQDTLLANLKSIEATHPDGEIGLYIKNLRTGKELSYKGDQFWYIASGVKLPLALEVLRRVDEKTLGLDSKVEVLETDYIDGTGELNYIKPQSQVSIRLLLDQSLTFSDNTASDILFRHVGVDNVNALMGSLVPRAFNQITSLAEVRRQVFSQFHPTARNLSNADFIRLRVLKDENAKLDLLSKLLKIERSKFNTQELESAYEAYYAEGLNSATLRGYGHLLEKISQETVLKEETQKYLIDTLERVETGKNRIKSGFPKSFVFAHKTGSQYRRYCDMGIIRSNSSQSEKVIIAACTRKLPFENAEKQLQKIGEAVFSSGVFSKKSKNTK